MATDIQEEKQVPDGIRDVKTVSGVWVLQT